MDGNQQSYWKRLLEDGEIVSLLWRMVAVFESREWRGDEWMEVEEVINEERDLGKDDFTSPLIFTDGEQKESSDRLIHVKEWLLVVFVCYE
jgi:hypothetical protein